MAIMLGFANYPFLLMVMCTSLHSASSATVSVPSERVRNLQCLLSQNFSGEPHVMENQQHGKPPRSLTVIDFQPAQVPALPAGYAILLKERVDGKVARVQILDFSEDPDGIIRIMPYNITNLDESSYDSVNEDMLLNLRREDLSLDEECEAIAQESRRNVFVIMWPDCWNRRGAHIPTYYDLLTCTKVLGFVNEGERELFSPTPYVYKSVGSIPTVDNHYTSICPQTPLAIRDGPWT